MSRLSTTAFRSRWHTLDRADKLALAGLAALTTGAVCVRAWLMISYAPGFLGFPDSWQYVTAALHGVFGDVSHPAGYPIFLALIHFVSNNLTFTIGVQHALGLATGLVLYASVRRTGAPSWLGLLPAAVAFFGGTGLVLEHSLLADPLFAFLQVVGVYFAVRAMRESALRWSLLAGAAIGMAFWIKTVAVSSAIPIPLLLLCASPGDIRQRLSRAVATSLVVAAFIGAYVGVQYAAIGYLGVMPQGAWNLYGRVATFVDCSTFTPPRGTAFLCPSQPLGHREAPSDYQYSPNSPAVERFGAALDNPLGANTTLQRFSVAAIEQEPVRYMGAIVRGFGFYLFPRGGEGYTPQSMRAEIMNASAEKAGEKLFKTFYSDGLGYVGSPAAARPLLLYERYSLIQGPFLVLLLVAALGGLLFLPSPLGATAALFTFTALFSITFAIAGNNYDARYAYPTFGLLAAGSALGLWGMGRHLAGAIQRTRRAWNAQPESEGS